MASTQIRWIARSVLICVLVCTCYAQFQRQTPAPQRRVNPFFQERVNQPPFNQFSQSQQNDFHQQQHPRSGGASCPEPNGRFPVPTQCDAYIECIDGVGEEKLCPEGLLFNPEARFNYPCGYPIDVQCLGRSALQPAQPTEECPHQFGYFKMGDRTNCGKFMNCVDGRSYVFDCPEGLAYNPETYRCDWPDQVPDCDAEAFLGFTCPTQDPNSFLVSETRFYRSPNDCQHYYICVDNRPRLQNCGAGHAFNELINACDAAENVTGCEPPQTFNEVQQVRLDQPQHQNNLRTFQQKSQPQNAFIQQNSINQQPNYNRQQNYNQQQGFGAFNQPQSRRNQQARGQVHYQRQQYNGF